MTFHEGDLVEAVKGDRVIRDRIHKGSAPVFNEDRYLGVPILFGPSAIRAYISAGYTLTLIEKAAPPVPTEEGFYLDKDGDVVELRSDDPGLEQDFAPYTRLEPVPETAEKIAAFAEGYPALAAQIRAKFGANS